MSTLTRVVGLWWCILKVRKWLRNYLRTSPMTKIYTTRTASETKRLGQKLSPRLKGGEVIYLIGALGSGKTTFVQGLASALGVKQIITSPTFVLMKVYALKHKAIRQLVHVDCYRLPAGRYGVPRQAISEIGLTDYLQAPKTVVVIEWADKLKLKLKPALIINFKAGTARNSRLIKVKTKASKA